MKISAILEAMRAALEPWAKGEKGMCVVAGDVAELFGILGRKPGGFRCVVACQSGARRGIEEAGCEDTTFLVVLSRGRGFGLEPGKSLYEGTAGGKPLFDLLEDARNVVKLIELTPGETEGRFSFVGFSLFKWDLGFPNDAYQLEFKVGRLIVEA